MQQVHHHGVKKTGRQISTRHRLCFLILSMFVTSAAVSQPISAPEPQPGTIIGTVTDENDATVPGATVAIEGSSLPDPQPVKTSDDGFFKLDHLSPATPYHVTVSASGFADWTSPEVILKPGPGVRPAQTHPLSQKPASVRVIEGTVISTEAAHAFCEQRSGEIRCSTSRFPRRNLSSQDRWPKSESPQNRVPHISILRGGHSRAMREPSFFSELGR